MVEDDMLSSSIMQSAYSKCHLVMSKTNENILLHENGIKCTLVEWDPSDIVKKTEVLINHLSKKDRCLEENKNYILKELNISTQSKKIFDRIKFFNN